MPSVHKRLDASGTLESSCGQSFGRAGSNRSSRQADKHSQYRVDAFNAAVARRIQPAGFAAGIDESKLSWAISWTVLRAVSHHAAPNGIQRTSTSKTGVSCGSLAHATRRLRVCNAERRWTQLRLGAGGSLRFGRKGSISATGSVSGF